MNHQEARFILNGCRPDGRDAGDPMFAEALEQVASDPALSAWWSRAQAHDAAMAAKLSETMPPPGLRGAILAGGRASSRNAVGRRAVARWSVGLAAAIALAAAAMFWRSPAAGSPDLVQFALRDAARGWTHGHEGSGPEELQAWLGSKDARLGGSLPISLHQLREKGCRVVDVAGREVLEICFKKDGRWLHLYAVQIAPDAKGLPLTPMLTSDQGQSCVTWTDVAQGYQVAVVGSGGPEMFQALL